MIGYSIQSSAPPFPVYVMAFTFNGIGMALLVRPFPSKVRPEIDHYRRTPSQMDTSPLLKTMPTPRWDCYTPPMVRTVSLYRSFAVSQSTNYTGVGALSAPLVSTQFSHLRHWSFHYFVSLAIAILNAAILCMVFRFKTQDGELHLVSSKYFDSRRFVRMSRRNWASV